MLEYTHHNPQENPSSDAVQQTFTDSQDHHAKLLPKPIAEAGEVETGDSKPFEAFSKPVGQFGTKDFTVAFWLKTTEKGKLFDLAGNRTAGSHGNFICIRMTGKHESAPEGRVSVEVDQDGNGSNYTAVNSERHDLNDGHWHQVAVVRQGVNLKLYIDGKLSAQERGSGIAAIENGNEFRIGRSYPEGINAQVKYNYFRIYEVALSEQAIAGLYEQDCCSQLQYQPVVKQEQEVQVGEPNEPFVSFGRKVGQFETRDFTISFWFNTTEKTRYFDLAGNRVCGSHGNFVCLRMSGIHESVPEGTVHLEVDQEEDGTNYISVMSAQRHLNDGRWHHVAAVRKDSNLKLYIDGKLSNEGFGAGTADISNGRDFRLGRSYPHFANVRVKYQHLGLYEVAFSDKEVGCLFEQASKSLYVESKNEPSVECFEMEVDESTPYFSLGKNVGQFSTSDFTVSFWFKTTTKSRYFDLIGNRTAGSGGNFFCVRMYGQNESMPEGSITAEVDQDDNGTNYIYVSSKRKGLNDGKWHHVAVVRSGILLELYVDGRLNAQDRSREVTNIDNTNEFRLGKSYSGFDNVRIGYRNFAIYERALSDEDIEIIFEKKF